MEFAREPHGGRIRIVNYFKPARRPNHENNSSKSNGRNQFGEFAGRDHDNIFKLFQHQQVFVARDQIRAREMRGGGQNAVVIRIAADLGRRIFGFNQNGLAAHEDGEQMGVPWMETEFKPQSLFDFSEDFR